jgi:hypothetical protein
MDEITSRKEQIEKIKESGQYLIDNADKLDSFILYATGSPEHDLMLQYFDYYGAWESVIGSSEILKQMLMQKAELEGVLKESE